MPDGAITPDQIAAAVATARSSMAKFRSGPEQVTAVLHAAWPDVPVKDIPDEAHDAAYTAALAAVHSGRDSVIAALRAANPHMPTAPEASDAR